MSECSRPTSDFRRQQIINSVDKNDDNSRLEAHKESGYFRTSDPGYENKLIRQTSHVSSTSKADPPTPNRIEVTT